jgi:1-deoxy-D-xylulose-5-phosphate synthase
VDQVIHDVALPHLPVVLAVDRAGFVSGDGETHQGLFDMSLFGPVPGLAIIAPACRAEVEMALAWALERSGPVMMRWPRAVCGPDLPELQQELTSGRGVFVRYLQSEALIVNVGGLLPQCLAAAHLLNLRGISTDIYNLRFVKPLDRAYLKNVLGLYRFAVLVEEGTARGGVGEHVGRILGGTGWPEAFRAIGVENAFLPQGSREQLLADSGLDGAGIASVVQALCEHDGPGELRTRAARIAVT